MIARWTPTALRDIESLHTYIAKDSRVAAAAVVEEILLAIKALERHPEMGRRGRVAGTRELVVTPYVIAYGQKSAALEIVAIIHAARKWPDSF